MDRYIDTRRTYKFEREVPLGLEVRASPPSVHSRGLFSNATVKTEDGGERVSSPRRDQG